MAKPIGNGKGEGNSALHRSWLIESVVDYFTATNQGDEAVQEGNGTSSEETILGSNRNDFFYIDSSIKVGDYSPESQDDPFYDIFEVEDYSPAIGLYNGGKAPFINGDGGADQIIMTQDAFIEDGFFENIENFTVLKLWDGKDPDVLEEAGDDPAILDQVDGSAVLLGVSAQIAGIREVTGGPGDDVIDFSGYVIEEDDFGEPIPLDIIIRGGAGADEMTASDGNDTFIWKAGDMEGTDADNFDTIYDFNVEDDVLNIAGLLEGFGFDATVNDLYDWVKVEQIDNSDPVVDDTLISIDSDGIGPNGFEELVLLQGVEFFNIDDIVV